MEYRKSYRGLALWLAAYTAALFSPLLLPKGTDADLQMRLVFNLTSAGIVGLMWIILRTESVYWINGVTFEQARDAGSARRRAFAAAHLRAFGWFALGYAAFSAVTQLSGCSHVLDIVVFIVGLIAAAASTLRVKL